MKYNAENQRDSFLVHSTIEGNLEAFNVLLDRYYSSAFSLAYNIVRHPQDAEDIVQEGFIKLWQSIDHWESTRASFKTWMTTIICRSAIDFYRKKKRTSASLSSTSIDDISELSIPIHPDQPEDALLHQANKEMLMQAINKLPYQQRMGLYLYHYEGFSYQAIAQIMDMSKEAITSLLSRAKISLKQHLQSLY